MYLVKKLNNFPEKKMSKSQFGFWSKRYTASALMEITEEITTAKENKNCTIGVFID